MEARQIQLLRRAFLIGAVTDALALIPMLVPEMAKLLWGFDATSGPYWFAMGYGGSLMLGWTVLLIWAYQRPAFLLSLFASAYHYPVARRAAT